MVIANISFGYENKFTAKEIDFIIEHSLNSISSSYFSEDGHIWHDCIMDLDKALLLNCPFTIKKILASDMNEVQKTRFNPILNDKCSVAVAGFGLMFIDEVKVRLDFCTEALQDELHKGWKILAICVQPNQRRPDYILGKTNH